METNIYTKINGIYNVLILKLNLITKMQSRMDCDLEAITVNLDQEKVWTVKLRNELERSVFWILLGPTSIENVVWLYNQTLAVGDRNGEAGIEGRTMVSLLFIPAPLKSHIEAVLMTIMRSESVFTESSFRK